MWVPQTFSIFTAGWQQNSTPRYPRVSEPLTRNIHIHKLLLLLLAPHTKIRSSLKYNSPRAAIELVNQMNPTKTPRKLFLYRKTDP